LLAKIISAGEFKRGLDIVTDRGDYIQVLTMNYHIWHTIKAHRHTHRPRTVDKTQEAIVVLQGSVEVTTFGDDNKVVDVRLLKAGDIYILFNGGVEYRTTKNDTKMVEIKPGHYIVNSDDEDRELIQNDGNVQ